MESLDERKQRIKKSIWESFLFSFLFLVFGIVLLLKEVNMMSTFIVALGFFCLLFGGISFIHFFRMEQSIRKYRNDFTQGLILFLFGGIAILKSEELVSMLTFMVGIYLIYKNVKRIEICMFLNDNQEAIWRYLMGLSGIGIFLGLFVILNPFSDIQFTMILGVCILIAEGLTLLQNGAILIKMRKQNEK
ncbi:MAG: hypothetical protein HFH86_01775 [Bacilli bacterium]|nr:hypothetical protein [Bacilli bacterium]